MSGAMLVGGGVRGTKPQDIDRISRPMDPGPPGSASENGMPAHGVLDTLQTFLRAQTPATV